MDLLSKLILPFQRALRESISSFIDLETSDNETTIVAKDGSLISYVKIDGSRQIIGEEEYDKIIKGATIKIGSRFDRLGHAIQIYFARDPARVRKELEKQFGPSRKTAQNSNLDIQDVFDERVNHLQRYVTHEETYFVLWTRPTVLSKSEVEKTKKEAKEKAQSWLNAPNAQYPNIALEPLRTRHKSYVSAVMAALDELGISGNLLEVHDALNCVRSNFIP